MTHIIPKSRLNKWAIKKLYEKVPTVDLIDSVEDLADKAAIAIVALLEVEPELRYVGMCVDEMHYTKLCHSYISRIKKEWGFE